MVVAWLDVLKEIAGLAIVKFDEAVTPESCRLLKTVYPDLDLSRTYRPTEARRLLCRALVKTLRDNDEDDDYVIV